MSVYTDQGMKVSEPGRAVNLLFCNGRHLKHTKFPSLRYLCLIIIACAAVLSDVERCL